MRVVIDTNVFVSSFFGGNPRKVIDLWKQGKLSLCLSRAIIDEYTEVLQRIGIEQTDLRALLQLFANGYNSLFAGKTPKLQIVKDDPDDDIFFECAVALKASHIISGDKAVLAIKKYVTIDVLTPQAFLALMPNH